MKRFLFLLLVPLQFAFAQSKPKQVFTYVERMPELPGGGGNAAIVNAIMKRLQVTKAALEASEGRPLIYFEVAPTGQVQHVRLAASSYSAGLDSALLVATRNLPKFKPGYRQGRPVMVSFTVPISCIKPQ